MDQQQQIIGVKGVLAYILASKQLTESQQLMSLDWIAKAPARVGDAITCKI